MTLRCVGQAVILGVVSLTASLFAFGEAVSYAHGFKDPVYPPFCWVQPSGGELWYPCDSDEAKMADCVALMETAMKALDPFVLSLGSEGYPTLKESSDNFRRALKVWERAKITCWSDLKDRPENKHYH